MEDTTTVKKIRRKNIAWQRYLETKEEQKYNEYAKLRNQVRNLTRKGQRKMEQQVAKEVKTNPKKFWA